MKAASLVALSSIWLVTCGTCVRARRSMDLSGPWQFRTDPEEVGEAEKWFSDGGEYETKIMVPGAWNAQGVGTQSDRMFHEFPGPAWYRRTVEIPESWKDKVIWLKFGGVHRYADVWVNGAFAGTHIGYLTPFKFDISRLCHTGANSIVVRVDARQRKDVDPLIGCFDSVDAMYITWGGIYRGVSIETTERTWIENVFVVPHIDSRSAEVNVEVGSLSPTNQVLTVKADVHDQDGKPAGSSEARLQGGASSVSMSVAIAQPRLWCPRSPHLYAVTVRLADGSREIDQVATRFGMREIKVEGVRILLNGRPIFLRGYGDDCVFPNTVAPPADKQEYYRRLKLAKAYGFNYVRHHSWFPLPEYFDVADELGMMVQPEFPIAYQGNYDDRSPERRQLYIDQWTGIIKASRNHPSIVTWCMGNELVADELTLAPEFGRIARLIDPTRLLILTDGTGMVDRNNKYAGLIDFVSVGFNESSFFGFGDRKFEKADTEQPKPLVVHEMADMGTLPDPSQAELFHGGIRPFWLYAYRDLAEKKGARELLPEWVDISNKLQAVCLKTNFEAARRARWLSGYDQWLFQDYWTGSNGIVDMFFRAKGLSAAECRKCNSPTVLLMDVPRRNFSSGEAVKLSFLVSRFEDEPSADAVLSWELSDGAQVLESGSRPQLKIASDGVQPLADVSLAMPQLTVARKLTLAAELTDSNGKTTNNWSFWVFPTDQLAPGAQRIVVGGLEQLPELYPWAEKAADRNKLGGCDLLVSSRFVPGSVDYLASGGRVLLLAADQAFPVLNTMYKPYFWVPAGPFDSTGAEIRAGHPALQDMPNDGWCDLEFYRLINQANSVVLDRLPVKVDPIVRCLDTHVSLANRAFLVEFSVGKGKLLVSTFNFADALAAGDPAAPYLLDRLVRYALGPRFAPTASLPREYLRLAEGPSPARPTAPRVNGFEQMLSSTGDVGAYHNYPRCWIIRESDGARRLEWETAPVKLGNSDKVSLVWTGALGSVGDAAGYFTVSLNGKPLLDFDVTQSSRAWASADGRAALYFDMKEKLNQDAYGVMYLTVPAETLTDGKPATISVVGAKSNSGRWFAVADVRDTIDREGL